VRGRQEVNMGSVDNQMFEEALTILREENNKLRKYISNLEKMIEDFINIYNNRVN
jgi:hypothetical protein